MTAVAEHFARSRVDPCRSACSSSDPIVKQRWTRAACAARAVAGACNSSRACTGATTPGPTWTSTANSSPLDPQRPPLHDVRGSRAVRLAATQRGRRGTRGPGRAQLPGWLEWIADRHAIDQLTGIEVLSPHDGASEPRRTTQDHGVPQRYLRIIRQLGSRNDISSRGYVHRPTGEGLHSLACDIMHQRLCDLAR